MFTPPYLRKGDKIAIVSPSRKITLAELDPAIRTFEEWGLDVVAASHLFSSHHQYAGGGSGNVAHESGPRHGPDTVSARNLLPERARSAGRIAPGGNAHP